MATWLMCLSVSSLAPCACLDGIDVHVVLVSSFPPGWRVCLFHSEDIRISSSAQDPLHLVTVRPLLPSCISHVIFFLNDVVLMWGEILSFLFMVRVFVRVVTRSWCEL